MVKPGLRWKHLLPEPRLPLRISSNHIPFLCSAFYFLTSLPGLPSPVLIYLYASQYTCLRPLFCLRLLYPTPVGCGWQGYTYPNFLILLAHVYLGNMFQCLLSGHFLGQWSSFLPILCYSELTFSFNGQNFSTVAFWCFSSLPCTCVCVCVCWSLPVSFSQKAFFEKQIHFVPGPLWAPGSYILFPLSFHSPTLQDESTLLPSSPSADESTS